MSKSRHNTLFARVSRCLGREAGEDFSNDSGIDVIKAVEQVIATFTVEDATLNSMIDSLSRYV